MAEKVKFKYGTKAQYDTLSTKDENTLYFTYGDGDTQGRLFKGSVEITSEIIDISYGKLTGSDESYQVTITKIDGTSSHFTVLSDTAIKKLGTWYVANNNLTATDALEGIVKLSDSISSTTLNTTKGTAATPKAVYDAIVEAKDYTDQQVSGGLAGLNGAMVLMGTVTSQADLAALTDVKKGYTYIVNVSTSTSIGGHTVESGDKLIAAKDSPSPTTKAEWYVTQANIEGAVTASSNLTQNQLVIGSDASGKGVKTLGAGTNGQVLKMVSGVPSWATDDNTKVTQNALASTESGRKFNVLLQSSPNSSTSETGEVNFHSGFQYDPSTKTLEVTATNASNAATLGSTTADTGSTTKPIYLKKGVATEGSTYAGGTAVTLNGSAKGSSTASFYAPTAAGTSGQYLVSAGASKSPTWKTADTTVTQNSTALVTSGAVYSGIVGAIEDSFDEYLTWQPIATA